MWRVWVANQSTRKTLSTVLVMFVILRPSLYVWYRRSAENSGYNFIMTCGRISSDQVAMAFSDFSRVVNVVNAPYITARSGHNCLHVMCCNFRARLTHTRVKSPSWLAKTLRDWIHTLCYFRRRKNLNRCLTRDRNHWWVFDYGL